MEDKQFKFVYDKEYVFKILNNASDIYQIQILLTVTKANVIEENKEEIKEGLLKFLDRVATEENSEEAVEDVEHLINYFEL